MNAARFAEPIRGHSRRLERRPYSLEHLSREVERAGRRERAPELVASLTAAGAVGSTLRRALKQRDIDPKLARLVLLFYGRQRLRAAEVAWRLNVSRSTASRHLDRAERAGLVDKLYEPIDRRGTWARLTERGRAFRHVVESILSEQRRFERWEGEHPAHGWRAANWYDP
jgi:DNA-binding MarR family transcriptional regulator